MVPPLRRLATSWRRPPAVYGRDDTIRHASWLELFFDLVFVVAIAELGSHLHENLETTGLLSFVWVFLLVWWVWMAFSYHSDMFDTDDLFSRLALVVAMFLVIFLSQTIDGVFHGESFAFTLVLVALRAELAILYFRERVEESDAGAFLTGWTGSEFLTVLILTVSLFVPPPGRYGLWLAALGINLGGVFVLYTVLKPIVVQVSHFPERLGLMTIVVLGETILAVAFGTSAVPPIPELAARTYFLGGAGFAIAVALWWLYFERFDERFIDRLMEVRDHTWLEARERGLIYVFSHFPIHIGVVATGVGISAAIESSVEAHALSGGGLTLLCWGTAAFLVGCSVCHRVLPNRIRDAVVGARVATAVALLAVPFVFPAASPVLLVTALALALVGLIVFEARTTPKGGGEPSVQA